MLQKDGQRKRTPSKTFFCKFPLHFRLRRCTNVDKRLSCRPSLIDLFVGKRMQKKHGICMVSCDFVYKRHFTTIFMQIGKLSECEP